jgi:hypothetical protein
VPPGSAINYVKSAHGDDSSVLSENGVAMLNALIGAGRPHSVLLVLPSTFPGIEPGQCAADVRVDAVPAPSFRAPAVRYDTVLLFRVLEQLPKANGLRMVAALRDLHARNLLVVMQPEADGNPAAESWTRRDLLALGFRELGYCEGGRDEGAASLPVYGFSLEDYKTTPEWLNAGYWAHPELFDRYRW